MYDVLSSPFFNHRSSRGNYRNGSGIYIAGCIEGTREMFLSNWPPPKNSFSRFSIPIIEACCCSQEEEKESFLNYPVKTKGNRCGYRLVRLRLQIRYRLPRDKILSSLFRLKFVPINPKLDI